MCVFVYAIISFHSLWTSSFPPMGFSQFTTVSANFNFILYQNSFAASRWHRGNPDWSLPYKFLYLYNIDFWSLLKVDVGHFFLLEAYQRQHEFLLNTCFFGMNFAIAWLLTDRRSCGVTEAKVPLVIFKPYPFPEIVMRSWNLGLQ